MVDCFIGIEAIHCLMRLLPSEVNDARIVSVPLFITILTSSIPWEKTPPALFHAFSTPTSYPDGKGTIDEPSWMALKPATDFWMISIPESNPAIDSCRVFLLNPNTATGLPCPNDTRSRSISDSTKLGVLPWRRLFEWPCKTYATRRIASLMPVRKRKSSASGIVPGPTADPRKRISNNGLVSVKGRTSDSTRHVGPASSMAVVPGGRGNRALAPFGVRLSSNWESCPGGRPWQGRLFGVSVSATQNGRTLTVAWNRVPAHRGVSGLPVRPSPSVA